MKTFHLYSTLWTVMVITMTFVACNNDDDKSSTMVSGTVGVDLRLDAQSDLAQFADAYVVSYVNGHVSTDTLDLSTSFTKHIVGSNPTDTVGYIVYLSPKPTATEGTHEGRYDLHCTATATENGRETGRLDTSAGTGIFRTAVGQGGIGQDSVVMHLFTVKNGEMVHLPSVSATETGTDKVYPDLPDTDRDTPFPQGQLYYAGTLSDATDPNLLSDNLAARFTGRKQWNAEQLSYGDLLFIHDNELASLDKGRIKEAADKGVVFVYEGGRTNLEALCEITDIPCLVIPDCSDDLYFLSKGAAVDGQTKADPIFLALTPHDEDGRYLDDFMQGQTVDMALRHVASYLEGHGTAAGKSRAALGNDAPVQTLNQLVSAYRVSLLLPQTVRRDEYRNPELKGLDQVPTNLYEVNYSIWNVFSLDEKKNYYYVHQELTAAFSSCYHDVYNKSVAGIAKVCEWYGKNIKTSLCTVNNPMMMHSEYSSPATTAGSTTYTSGISFGISGTVGYSAVQGPMASASANLSFSSSTSYSVPDVMVYNRCRPGEKFEWEYDLADVTSSFSLFSTACTQLRPGSAAGRSTLVAGADYMFSFPEMSTAPTMSARLEVGLRSSCSKCGITCKVRDKNSESSVNIRLPFLTSHDFDGR